MTAGLTGTRIVVEPGRREGSPRNGPEADRTSRKDLKMRLDPSMNMALAAVLVAGSLAAAAGCGGGETAGETEESMNGIAGHYVRLVLAVGEHDARYVDAWYGPEEMREEVRARRMTLLEIEEEADSLLMALEPVEDAENEGILERRGRFLLKQLRALAAYTRILQGVDMTFDERTSALYDVTAAVSDTSGFAGTLSRIDELLPPGEGTLAERLERYRNDFIIPADSLEQVFAAAIDEARRRTRAHIDLPEGESFDVSYVTGKPWGAYNWYKGDAHSLIEVNTDLPSYIRSPVGLACHEGYPGHHAYNALLEKRMVEGRGWVEFSVYPLYSPLSLLAEGTANFGIEVAFPGDERLEFEREVLYPLAGLDPSRAARYAEIDSLSRKLSAARVDAARMYLSGEADVEKTVRFLTRWALLEPERAKKLVSFFDAYGTYIVNYYAGQDLVRDYVEKMGGTPGRPDRRWEVFGRLLTEPFVPSDLRRAVQESS